MKQVFKALPSLLGGMYVLFLLIYKPELYLFLLPTLIYLLVSLADGRMQWLNNVLLYALVTGVLLFEGFIRVWPEIVPTILLSCLHKDVRNPIADMRGYFTSETMAGTGMAYHYKPNSEHKYPHVVIDKNGYRNTREYQEDVDIVLLGDSLIFAGEAKNDLGELFRQAGYRTMNLAMGGYAPQHYLHSYKTFIVDKKSNISWS